MKSYILTLTALCAALAVGCEWFETDEDDVSTCGTDVALAEDSTLSGRIAEPGDSCSYLFQPARVWRYILTVDAAATASGRRPSVTWTDTEDGNSTVDHSEPASGRYFRNVESDRKYRITVDNATSNDITYSVNITHDPTWLGTVHVKGTIKGGDTEGFGYYYEDWDGKRIRPLGDEYNQENTGDKMELVNVDVLY